MSSAMRHHGLIPLLVLVAGDCGTSPPDTFVLSGYDQQDMTESIARARAAVDSFIRERAHPTGSRHAVKAPIEEDAYRKLIAEPSPQRAAKSRASMPNP